MIAVRFPPAAPCGAVGGFFWGIGGQRLAGACLLGQRLRCCPSFLGLVVELGLRRSASLLSRLRGDA